MRKSRSSGSVEGVMGDHNPYSDSTRLPPGFAWSTRGRVRRLFAISLGWSQGDLFRLAYLFDLPWTIGQEIEELELQGNRQAEIAFAPQDDVPYLALVAEGFPIPQLWHRCLRTTASNQ